MHSTLYIVYIWEAAHSLSYFTSYYTIIKRGVKDRNGTV